MGYKMKGYSYPGKSPLKQDKVPNMTEEESKAFRNRWNAKIDMVEEMKDHAKTIGQADDGMRIYEEGDIIDTGPSLLHKGKHDPIQKEWARNNKNWEEKKKSPAKQLKTDTYNTSTEEHAKENPYWYKVNGKRVSKHVYNKYQNKPGGDEIGKTTNDPDASGNKAKIAKDRASNKASKRPTVLTEAQTKIKK